MGFTSRLSASQSFFDASLKVFLIRWMMHVCTVVIGHTLPTTSGSPLRPSQTRKNVSATPRFFISVRTLIQNFAPSPPVPAQSPRTSFWPDSVTPIACLLYTSDAADDLTRVDLG